MPKVTESRAHQNAFGATFVGGYMAWASGDAYMTLDQCHGSKDVAQLEMGLTSSTKEAAQRFQNAASAASAADL